jgi:DNA-binding NarL/FixJ family response regulator
MHEGKIKLLIADDHAILRQGLRRILEAEPDLTVVGDAATGSEAAKLAKQLSPDLVIMDISMPDQDGIQSLRQIVAGGYARVLILTVHLEHEVISEAITAGASGYLAKDSADRELISAIRTIMHGGTVFSRTVLKRIAEPRRAAATAATFLESLTDREREVFLLLAEGKSPSEAAKTLYLSAKTVHTHRQHIMEKLGLKSTTELIRFALREGIIKTI